MEAIEMLSKGYLVHVLSKQHHRHRLGVSQLRELKICALRTHCIELCTSPSPVLSDTACVKESLLAARLQHVKDKASALVRQRAKKHERVREAEESERINLDFYTLTKRVCLTGTAITVSAEMGYVYETDDTPAHFVLRQELRCRVVTMACETKKKEKKDLVRRYQYELELQVVDKSLIWFGISRPLDAWQKTHRDDDDGDATTSCFHPASSCFQMALPGSGVRGLRIRMDEIFRVGARLTLPMNSREWRTLSNTHTTPSPDVWTTGDMPTYHRLSISDSTMYAVEQFGALMEMAHRCHAATKVYQRLFRGPLFDKKALDCIRSFCY